MTAPSHGSRDLTAGMTAPTLPGQTRVLRRSASGAAQRIREFYRILLSTWGMAGAPIGHIIKDRPRRRAEECAGSRSHEGNRDNRQSCVLWFASSGRIRPARPCRRGGDMGGASIRCHLQHTTEVVCVTQWPFGTDVRGQGASLCTATSAPSSGCPASWQPAGVLSTACCMASSARRVFKPRSLACLQGAVEASRLPVNKLRRRRW